MASVRVVASVRAIKMARVRGSMEFKVGALVVYRYHWPTGDVTAEVQQVLDDTRIVVRFSDGTQVVRLKKSFRPYLGNNFAR